MWRELVARRSIDVFGTNEPEPIAPLCCRHNATASRGIRPAIHCAWPVRRNRRPSSNRDRRVLALTASGQERNREPLAMPAPVVRPGRADPPRARPQSLEPRAHPRAAFPSGLGWRGTGRTLSSALVNDAGQRAEMPMTTNRQCGNDTTLDRMFDSPCWRTRCLDREARAGSSKTGGDCPGGSVGAKWDCTPSPSRFCVQFYTSHGLNRQCNTRSFSTSKGNGS